MSTEKTNGKASAALNRMRDVIKHRHDYAKDWKRKHPGGAVFGRFCTYVPEEILSAAGILPVRIMGSHERPDITDPYIWSWFCGYSRDCLAQGLKGHYEYLDGIVKARSCPHMRGAYFAWTEKVPVKYSYWIGVPQALSIPEDKILPSVKYLKTELERFKQSLEEWSGRCITDEDLDQAIQVYNTNRGLMRQLYDLRKADKPIISGSEAAEIALAGQLMDKTEHSQLLTDLLEDLSQKQDAPEPGLRLMMMGSENDDIELLQFIESLGGTFVIDDDCIGSRYFWDDINPLQDRLHAIATRYIERVPCPLKDYPESRRTG